MIYDDCFIIFGNSELRININEKTAFSNFGTENSPCFDSRNRKVKDFLGEYDTREVELESYEIYQINFLKSDQKQKWWFY